MTEQVGADLWNESHQEQLEAFCEACGWGNMNYNLNLKKDAKKYPELSDYFFRNVKNMNLVRSKGRQVKEKAARSVLATTVATVNHTYFAPVTDANVQGDLRGDFTGGNKTVQTVHGDYVQGTFHRNSKEPPLEQSKSLAQQQDKPILPPETPAQEEEQVALAMKLSVLQQQSQQHQQSSHHPPPNRSSMAPNSACRQLHHLLNEADPKGQHLVSQEEQVAVTPAQLTRIWGDDSVSAGEAFASPATSTSTDTSISVQDRVMATKPSFLPEYKDVETISTRDLGVPRLDKKAVVEKFLPMVADKVANAIKNNTMVRNIDFQDCPITAEGAEAMVLILKYKLIGVEYLNFSSILDQSDSEDGPKVIAALCEGFRDAPHLRHVVANKQALGPEGSQMVAAWLETLPKLETVSLYDSGLDTEGVKLICRAITVKPHLKNLIIGRSTVASEEDDSALGELGNLVAQHPRLATLAFPGLRAGITRGCLERTLVTGMVASTLNSPMSYLVAVDFSEMNLGLGKNHISPTVQLLSAVFSKAPNLVQVNYNDTGCGPVEMESIFDAHRKSRAKLAIVSVECCTLKLLGAQSMGKYFSTYEGVLTELNMAATDMGNEGLKPFLDGVMKSKPKLIRYLNLSQLGLGDPGFRKIADFLQEFRVAKLCVEGNGLEPDSEVAQSIIANCGDGIAVLETPTVQSYQRSFRSRDFVVSPRSASSPALPKTSASFQSPPLPAEVHTASSTNVSPALSSDDSPGAPGPNKAAIGSPAVSKASGNGIIKAASSETAPSSGSNETSGDGTTKAASLASASTLFATKSFSSETAPAPEPEDTASATIATKAASSAPSASAPSEAAATSIATKTASSSASRPKDTEPEPYDLLWKAFEAALGTSTSSVVGPKVTEAKELLPLFKLLIIHGFGNPDRVWRGEALFSEVSMVCGPPQAAIGTILNAVTHKGVEVPASSSEKRTSAFFDLAREDAITYEQILYVLPIMIATLWVLVEVDKVDEAQENMLEELVFKNLIRRDCEKILRHLDVQGDWSNTKKISAKRVKDAVRKNVWKAIRGPAQEAALLEATALDAARQGRSRSRSQSI